LLSYPFDFEVTSWPRFSDCPLEPRQSVSVTGINNDGTDRCRVKRCDNKTDAKRAAKSRSESPSREKNAELKKLENNGYQPGWGNNADTQQRLQNAPRKAAPKSGGASPTSAP
jgi:hypothetical protein